MVAHPLCAVGRANLDFGKGFYITDIRRQAVEWATRIANIGLPQWLNVYELDDETAFAYRAKRFTAYITEETALRRLAMHKPNNQICILNQEIVERCLRYVRSEPLNNLAK